MTAGRINILGERNGLFSSINKVVTWLDCHPNNSYGVNWTVPNFCLYGNAGQNLWPVLFDSLPLLPDAKSVDSWPHYDYTGDGAFHLYRSAKPWRSSLNKMWRQLKLRREISAQVDLSSAMRQPGSIGVHIRNEQHRVEQPGGKISSLDRYVDVIHKRRPCGPIFLATDNDEAVQRMKKEFGTQLLYRDICRTASGNDELHYSIAQNQQDAIDCMIDVLTLASCEHFIHIVSNMATGVLYINPELSHTLLVGDNFARSFPPGSGNLAMATLERYPQRRIRSNRRTQR